MTTAAAPRRTGRGRGHGRGRALVLIAVAVLGVVALAAGIALLALRPAPGNVAGVDLQGNSVIADPDSQLTDAQKNAQRVEATGGRFVVPSVGLDVPLLAMNAVDGIVAPAGYTDAYLVRNLGVAPADAATGTVYAAMHSLRNGGVGPGNYLIDVAKGQAKVADGAEIDIDGVAYRVTGSKAVPKTALPTDASIWRAEPGTLVVFTCLQVPRGTASVDNIVITATLAP